MNQDLIKIIGIMFVVVILIYLASKSINFQAKMIEGLTNPDGSENTGTAQVAAATQSQNNGNNAKAYADEIKKIYTTTKDNFILGTYRVDYENVIIQLDDYINALMLKKILSLDKSQLTEEKVLDVITKINTLNLGKTSLNSIMKFVDAT
jgi:hypothetical protein